MTSKLVRAAALAGALVACVTAMNAMAAPNDRVADVVIGQVDFVTNGSNNPTRSASSLYEPGGSVVDSSGRLWLADRNNGRVLEYDAPLTSTTANRLFGQATFTSAPVSAPVSASSLSLTIGGVAIDTSGRLWVADSGNNRVLAYETPLTSSVATLVLGQPSFTSRTNNAGGLSASSLSQPTGVAIDGAGHLWVADFGNARVLEYDDPLNNPAAARVYGQPDFVSLTVNNGGLSDSSLNLPADVFIDGAGRLWIADTYNNRVLEYDTPLISSVATRVFGQPNMTSNAAGLGPNGLDHPFRIAVQSNGTLWVADEFNNRVLGYGSPLASQVATRVLGQIDFAHKLANDGGLSASSLSSPFGVSADTSGHLWVSDANNSRALAYDLNAPVGVGGIAEQPEVASLRSGSEASGRGYTAWLVGAVAGVVLAIAGAWRLRARRMPR